MKIKSFDGLELVDYEIDDDIPLEFVSERQTLPGQAGAFDPFGYGQVRAPLTITRSYELVADTYADIDDQLDAIRAKANRGRRWLVIEMRDGDTRGTWAKLTRVQAPYRPDFLQHLPVQLTFEINWPWFEDTTDIWYLDAGEDLDDGLTFDRNYTLRGGSGPSNITNNGGDAITRGLLVIKGSSVKPAVVNNTNGWSITFGRNVPAGSTLFIDVGAQTARMNGEDVWADITLGENQVGFFRLETGLNSLTFSGAGTLEIHWAEVY